MSLPFAADSLAFPPVTDPSPAEHVMRAGAEHMGEAALLSAITGLALRSARALVDGHGCLRTLCALPPAELASLPGMTAKRAAALLAGVEAGRRVVMDAQQRTRLRTPAEVAAYLTPRLGGLRREVFHVLCFDSRNGLLRDTRVAEGTANACPVDPREVFAAALSSRASGLVFAHNHPSSGDPNPSAQDIALTAMLAEAAQALGLKVLDHVIIGAGAYYSMLEKGSLPARRSAPGPAWS